MKLTTQLLLAVGLVAISCSNMSPSGDVYSVETGSASGLEGGSNHGNISLSLLTSCADDQILKWDDGGTAWVCSSDATGGSYDLATGETVQSVTASSNLSNVSLNSTTTVMKLVGTGSVSISGITGGADGRVLKVDNSTSGTITFLYDQTSTSGNRFLTENAFNQVLNDNGVVTLVYSGTDSRWHVARHDYQGGSSISLSGNSIDLSMPGTSCTSGMFMNDLTATGTGSCDDVSVNDGLTLTGHTVEIRQDCSPLDVLQWRDPDSEGAAPYQWLCTAPGSL